MANEDVQDLLKQIVTLKNENTHLKAFVDQIRPHFLIWKCPRCPNMHRFSKAPPTAEVMCELCNIEMRPHSIAQYRQLKDQYDELDEKHSQALAERNKYAKTIQELIPILQEYGYIPTDNNPTQFIKQQLTYLTVLEQRLAGLGKDEKLE